MRSGGLRHRMQAIRQWDPSTAAIHHRLHHTHACQNVNNDPSLL